MTVLHFPVKHSPLAHVGDIDIPPTALRHHYVLEVSAVVGVIHENRERVVGTSNRGPARVELYGWGANVQGHADNLGFIYFLPLTMKRSIVSAGDVRKYIRPGQVHRLDDRVHHYTRDTGDVVCLYAGVFKEPSDAQALSMLRAGIHLLASGDRAAPRVSEGFRVPMPWECWAGYEPPALMPIDEARRNEWAIATCAECGRHAYRLDDHYPYHQENNRCREHFRE